MKNVTLTDISRKPLDMRLQTNHHAHLFVVTHSYPTCPLPSSPLDLFEAASFEIGLRIQLRCSRSSLRNNFIDRKLAGNRGRKRLTGH
jgi:hypothetical protein